MTASWQTQPLACLDRVMRGAYVVQLGNLADLSRTAATLARNRRKIVAPPH
jgi:hypothetical protein